MSSAVAAIDQPRLVAGQLDARQVRIHVLLIGLLIDRFIAALQAKVDDNAHESEQKCRQRKRACGESRLVRQNQHRQCERVKAWQTPGAGIGPTLWKPAFWT